MLSVCPKAIAFTQFHKSRRW